MNHHLTFLWHGYKRVFCADTSKAELGGVGAKKAVEWYKK